MKLIFYDLETPKGCFLACFKQDNAFYTFEVSEFKSEVFELIKYLKDNEDAYYVGYNSLNFDSQVIEFIIRNYNKWINLSGKEIAKLIWQFASDTIRDTNFGGFPTYREESLSFLNIDIFKVQHFDNKNRRVGLKRLEYEMDMENIEEMNVPPDQASFTRKEIDSLIYYCHNDVDATELNYKHLIGEVDHEIYKGQNAIETRQVLSEEFGFNAMNYSDSKYGDEIIKTIYAKEAGCKYEELPKKGTFRKTVSFSKAIPDYIEFQTPELKKFLKDIRGKVIKGNEKFEVDLHFKEQTYTFALGGLHNVIKNKKYDSNDEYIILDVDVTGYYPRTIINRGYAPAHLNKAAFLRAYSWIVSERERLKPLSKKDKRIKGIVAGYKLAANSVYGKLGDMLNWLYDPQAILNVCITGELSILMLIEALELEGNKCIMANTDGATFYVKRSNLDKFYDTCNSWCKKTAYELEYFEFKKLYFLTVNDYIGQKVDGEIKAKGDFLTATELHKNKSFRVIPLALKEYFINNIEPETFINNFDNIFHFCGRSTAGNTYYHQAYDKGDSWKLPKIIRYYVAKKGYKIMKMVKEGNDTGANDGNVRPATEKKVVANNLPLELHKEHLENVDRRWYINEVREIIYRLETGKKAKGNNNNENQLSLFG